MVQDLALRPSTSTVQAPHWLVSQPTCVPVRLQLLAQEMHEQHARLHLRLAHLAVDCHRNLGHVSIRATAGNAPDVNRLVAA